MFFRVKIRSFEFGLHFVDGEFRGLVSPGRYWFRNLLGNVNVTVVSQRDPFLVHEKLDIIVKSGALDGHARVLDLKDHQRALVWIDGRFGQILGPGLHAVWTGQREITTEIVDSREVRFQHPELKSIIRSRFATAMLDVHSVERDHVGVYFRDGEYVDVLSPGEYAFWKFGTPATVNVVDQRESSFDILGQEIMTADKVTLRMNASVTFRIADARKVLGLADDVRQALYREAQLALRAITGTRELDSFLAQKDVVAEELERVLSIRGDEIGVKIVAVGIRDLILPGEMKELLNKVTEAKKSAEANLIVRREETAAMRSQANTAKLLADNPTLMRLRELEVLERIATTGEFKVIIGEKGLAERVVNLL